MANVFFNLRLACLKIIFTFLHLIYSCLHYFDLVWSLFKRKRDERFSSKVVNEELYISECVAGLEKKPNHLALILGKEAICFEDFSNFVIWCLTAGISFLSVFDNSGLNRENEAKLYEHVRHRLKSTHSVLKFRNLPTKNGVTSDCRNKIVVSILSEEDGKENYTRLVKRLCCEVEAGLRKLNEISIDVIDKEVKSDSKFPDPDLGVLVGPVVCTYGFPPWQISVTEFICVPALKNFHVRNFCSLLSKYSNRQQRFGK